MAEAGVGARGAWLSGTRAAALFSTIAAALCLLPLLFAGRWSLLSLALAQPLFSLAFSLWRGTRSLPDSRILRRDFLALLALWTSSYAVLALVVGWPLEALRESAALMSALSLSLAAGIALLGLWRTWPIIGLACRIGGSLSLLLASTAPAGVREAGRGLLVAVAVFAILTTGLLLAWPGMLPATPVFLLGHLVVSALGHAVIQQLGVAPTALPVVSMPPTSSDNADDGGEDEEETDPDRRLYAAAHSGRVDLALAALAEGGNSHRLPEPEDRDQRSLPMLAALLGDLRLLRELIGRGVDLNQSHAGLTPLLAATRDSWHGRPEAVMTLLANGADPRAVDADGNTPLHHAARSTDAAVAALLLDAGAEVDALNAEAITPLSVACDAGNWRMARFLIEHRAKPEPANGQPALLAAAGGDDDPAGVMLLLKHKARIDARGAQQRTALMCACAAGNAEIVGVLLDAGADRNAHDAQGMTPLLDAARRGEIAALRRLVAAKPEVAAVDAEARNALIHACEAGVSVGFLRELLALGIAAGHRDGSGRRALEVALGAGRWPLVAALDPSYPLPATLLETASNDAEESSTPALPLRTPRERLRDALQQETFDPALANACLAEPLDAGDQAVLLLELSDGDLTRFEWLLDHGASVESRTSQQGDSVTFALLRRGGGALPALQRLLERGAPVAGRGGLARYLDACVRHDHGSRGHEQFALALLERGADAFSAAEGVSEAPLMSAVRLGWQRLLEALLQQGANPSVHDVRGHAPLHLAATLGREAALRTLIRHGASPEQRAADGQTAQGMALATNRRDISQWLEWRGWTLPGRALQPFDLPAAAISGDRDAVERLLDLGLPVNGTDNQGCTALLRAAGGGHVDAVRLLLTRGADTAIAARTGATALSAAISMRQGAVVDALLQTGASANQSLPGQVSPLMLAAALGLPDIISRLLAAGADALATDSHGLGALHCGALHAFSSRDQQRVLAMFDLLLLADVPADVANSAGHTPLLLLLGARAEAGATCDETVLLSALERLLGEGVSLDRQDARGLGPLHLAAQHGLLRVVQRLLREGANRQLRDTLGRSAHDLALLRGYIDVASEFEPARSAPSLARFLRES